MLPPLTPADDLAVNPPGRALRDLLAESGPGLMERVVSRLLRRPSEWDSWRKGLAGERRVGAELNRLGRHGWRVLHSVPLANKVDIDHLLIGPGGVFSINTKHHHQRAVWVGDDSVKVDHGKPAPYARKSRAEAKRVARVLERYCDFPVPVEPVLVFVGVTELKVVATQLDARVYQERQYRHSLRSQAFSRPTRWSRCTAWLAIARLGVWPEPVRLSELPAFPAGPVGGFQGVTVVGAGCSVSAASYAPLLNMQFEWRGDADGWQRMDAHGPVSA
ncbi:nuclease-related domain-containing protein [Streptomyces sp. NPDC001633]|uniref:nuclease-related domain-containing protein n=1 Tax=Streptomyces sp. NPDC001633 TaxID=3364595 RepID=UPI0036B82E10